MVMTALTRKLLREVWHHRGQMLSIAAVVATGLMTVLTMRGTYESLVAARDEYYGGMRFPDLWVQLERAPQALVPRLRAIPGVAAVDTRVTLQATLDLPGLEVPGSGRFVSIPERREPMLGDLFLRSGRYVRRGRRDEIVVSDKFAAANALVPGSALGAIVNGRRRELTVVGTAISPEHIYAVPPGSIFPDDRRYGVIWMSRDALGPAYDMDGAFNEAVFVLSPRANAARVIDDIDRLLAPYGGLGAYGREDQPSHLIIDGELAQLRTLSTVIPVAFLAVAAFLLNIVLNRLIATQRTEIAVLKAFGYSHLEVGRHYVGFAMAAVLGGSVAGIAAGIWLGAAMVDLYGVYFDFPVLAYRPSVGLIVTAMGVSLAAAAAGALGAVSRATALPPAEAMRPEPPASFHPGWLERAGLTRRLPAAGRMILRNIERQPLRSLFSAVGVSFAVAILVVGLFMFDGLDYVMDLQFRVTQREDLSLTFNRPLSASVAHAIERLPGVARVETFRAVPVRLGAGHRTRQVALTGLEADRRLRRVVAADGRLQPLPPRGLVMSALLASQLGVSAGDEVTVHVLEGTRRSATVPVTGVVEDYLGLSAYMRLDALHALTRGGRTIDGAYLAVAADAAPGLHARLKQLPVVASVDSPEQMLAAFQAQLADSLYISVFFLLGFSSVIAVAVIYNGARIGLSERGRELASLRVLGFTRGEVALLLLGEQALVTLLAIPLGCLIGYGFATAVAAGLQTDAYRFPLLVSARTYFLASALTALAAVASGWIVRRRLNRLDLIAVLKTRE